MGPHRVPAHLAGPRVVVRGVDCLHLLGSKWAKRFGACKGCGVVQDAIDLALAKPCEQGQDDPMVSFALVAKRPRLAKQDERMVVGVGDAVSELLGSGSEPLSADGQASDR